MKIIFQQTLGLLKWCRLEVFYFPQKRVFVFEIQVKKEGQEFTEIVNKQSITEVSRRKFWYQTVKNAFISLIWNNFRKTGNYSNGLINLLSDYSQSNFPILSFFEPFLAGFRLEPEGFPTFSLRLRSRTGKMMMWVFSWVAWLLYYKLPAANALTFYFALCTCKLPWHRNLNLTFRHSDGILHLMVSHSNP